MGLATQTIADVIVEAIKHAMAPKDARIAELEQRIVDLEAKPNVKYCGVWRDDATYSQGDAVTKSGSLWIAKLNQLKSEPGNDAGTGWTLAVKRGADGRDAR